MTPVDLVLWSIAAALGLVIVGLAAALVVAMIRAANLPPRR